MAETPPVPQTPTLKRLHEQRVRAAEARKTYVERSSKGEEMSAEDTASYDKALKDVDHYGQLIKAEIERMQEDRDYTAAFEKAVGKAAGKGTSGVEDENRDGETLADLMRADLTKAKGGETRSGGIFQAIPTHRQFLKEQRDLTVGTATKGAELVPVTLVRSLYEKIFDDSALLQAGPTILRTQSGETLKLPRLTALNYTPGTTTPLTQAQSRVAEGGNILEAEPNFDQVQLDAYKYAQYTQLSRELVEDGVIDIEELVGRILGRNISNYLGTDLTLGTGTGQPRGVRTLVPAGAPARAITSFAALFTNGFDLFFDAISKLKPGYRRGAKWLVNDQSMFQLRKLKMGSIYAWEPNLQGAGMPDRFLGYPILADPNIPVFGTTSGISAIFGDFSAYYVRMVKDVRIEWSMEFAWVSDLISVKAVFRADGDAIDDTAFAAVDITS